MTKKAIGVTLKQVLNTAYTAFAAKWLIFEQKATEILESSSLKSSQEYRTIYLFIKNEYDAYEHWRDVHDVYEDIMDQDSTLAYCKQLMDKLQSKGLKAAAEEAKK